MYRRVLIHGHFCWRNVLLAFQQRLLIREILTLMHSHLIFLVQEYRLKSYEVIIFICLVVRVDIHLESVLTSFSDGRQLSFAYRWRHRILLLLRYKVNIITLTS